MRQYHVKDDIDAFFLPNNASKQDFVLFIIVFYYKTLLFDG
jgi:hypothetical protein